MEDDEILGFILVLESTTPDYNCLVPHRFAYITDLIVNPAHRGKCIGKALMKSVTNWSLEKGLDYIELNVLSENENAIKLYESLGYKEDSKTMRIRL